MGGAQAIGALAYGTESIERVDKIVGPGNAWVTAAKLEVLGSLRHRHARRTDRGDGRRRRQPRTPSTSRRTSSARPSTAPTPLPCWSRPRIALADAVEAEVARQLPTLPRRDILAASLAAAGHGRASPPTSTRRSPSPTSTRPSTSPCSSRDDEAALRRLRHAGSLFLGAYAPGVGRRLRRPAPTTSCRPLAARAPTARCRSRRSDAGCRSSASPATAWPRSLPAVAAVAEAEGLTAHRRAVEIRFEGGA